MESGGDLSAIRLCSRSLYNLVKLIRKSNDVYDAIIATSAGAWCELMSGISHQSNTTILAPVVNNTLFQAHQARLNAGSVCLSQS